MYEYVLRVNVMFFFFIFVIFDSGLYETFVIPILRKFLLNVVYGGNVWKCLGTTTKIRNLDIKISNIKTPKVKNAKGLNS